MRDDVFPRLAITDGCLRRLDDSEIFSLPICTDDESITEILELIFVIALQLIMFLLRIRLIRLFISLV